jgi:hypothetical protein
VGGWINVEMQAASGCQRPSTVLLVRLWPVAREDGDDGGYLTIQR